ncbi:LptA/OstA family protein [Erythrobacter sp. SDW2]|uniref:LptA/OstA family protein n=1 Tax=Erythrobacter sp. SDW2 TaxID=2907154 RepID=UPI001F3374E3|nr:LptA/OstA family protein [Erythrobacter sp. SDW2]UIP07466.1 LptA/OstA family protein [Erythrobacter sp. SDW2]
MTAFPVSKSGRQLRLFAIGFAATCAVAGGIQLNAQTFGGHNSRAPVDFDAGRLEVRDRENRVILSGSVIVNQAGLTVRSDRMVVNYDDSGALDVTRITATGGVVVTRGSDRASGGTAVYDLNSRIITMAGNVQLSRGGDRLSGGRLVINLDSGVASIDGRASGATTPDGGPVTTEQGGRVRGTFSVPQG